jgi:3-deoxy-manno-octulosonate cytidylyltransferase (CMP-KDO synthetase)
MTLLSPPRPRRSIPQPKIKRRDLYPTKTEDEYAKYLKGKRLIFVGPAGYLNGQGKGDWINSFDVVVKPNWGNTQDPRDYGRTDVLYKRALKLRADDEALVESLIGVNLKWLIGVDNGWARIDDTLKKRLDGHVSYFNEKNIRPALSRQMGTSALVGMVAVKHLLTMPIESLTITGCDFYMSGYGENYGGTDYRQWVKRKEGTIGPTHDGPTQLRWLKTERQHDARLRFDDVLDQLAKSNVLPDMRVMEGVTIIIPARYGSSRFPGKPLAPILGKPMILHVCERVSHMGASVIVATDDARISEVVTAAGHKAVMTNDAMTGTDRVAAAMEKATGRGVGAQRNNIFVNVQGDEPLIDPSAIIAVVEAKRKNRFEVINAMTELQPDEAESRDVVKAVVKKDKRLAYASRLPIPGGREGNQAKWKQLGLYAFNRDELRKFTAYGKRSPLEIAEDVEILRFIDMGHPVRMVEVKGSAQSVDQPEHIAIVEGLMRR